MYKVVILPLAQNDIRNSALWYEQQQKGLGQKFTKQVRQIVSLIRQNPKSFNLRYKNTRTAVLPIFPYLIHYNIDEMNTLVVILAVLHTSQNPKKWGKRGDK